MAEKMRKFITKSDFNKRIVIYKEKVVASIEKLNKCISDCFVCMSDSNINFLSKAIALYQMALFDYNFFFKQFKRDKEFYLALKENNLLSKEEIEKYDCEFCD